MALLGDLRTVLRERGFGRLYATRLVAQLGDGVFQVALASYVFFSPEQRTTGHAAAAAFATLLLPYSVVGPFAGVLIDRWSRQRILLVGNLLRALLGLAVAALVVGERLGPPFYVAALATLSVNRFFLAALSASLPHVVRTDLLAMGNSVSTTSGTLAAVLGAGLGYLVRAAAGSDNAGVAVVVLAAIGLYAGSALIVSTVDRRRLGPDPDEARPQAGAELRNVLRGVAAGARHVWTRRRARDALVMIAAHRFCYGISFIATILLYRNYFNRGGRPDAGLGGFALVVVVSGVGYLTAAVLTPPAVRRWSEERWIVGLFAAGGVVEIAFGAPYTQPLLLVAAYVLGIVAQGVKITVDTIVQASIVDIYRGRVFSFYDILFNVSFVSAAAFAAVTLPASGKSYAVLGVVAAGYALSALAYAWLRRTRRARSDRPGLGRPSLR